MLDELRTLIEKCMHGPYEKEKILNNKHIVKNMIKLSIGDRKKLLIFLREKSDNGFVAKLMGNFYRDDDHLESYSWFVKSAEMGDSMAMYNVGRHYCDGTAVKEDYSKAIEWFLKAVEKKNSTAMYCIGRLYYCGHVGEINYKEAVDWYMKAALLGKISAILALAEMYCKGIHFEKSYKEGLVWYLKAADLGETYAMDILGDIYGGLRWKDFPKNEEEAMKWYLKSANLGSRASMRVLGDRYSCGNGVRQDYKEALVWYKKSDDVEQDDYVMLNIGDHYHWGMGVSKNETEAMSWYMRSAMLDNGTAMTRIADFYYFRYGVERDHKEALKWYNKAALQGNGFAMNSIGYMYFFGEGCELNKKEALMWFRKAFSHGYADASLEIARYYKYEGENIKPDYKEMINSYQKGAELNSAKAMMELGNLYREGREGDVEKDEKLALKWYHDAVEGEPFDALTKIADVYLEQGNIDQAIKYYARARQKTKDVTASDKLKVKIRELVRKIKVDIFNEWITLVDENEKLKTEVMYQPDGDGFLKAQRNFIAVSKS
ncbi:MAG: hypothetical protein Harvfovirus1_30 [Harvfovirus sp.]|uniref:Uncharacterized protein n=1 Tax=Harvfovirus sp. TaxID=2487768 RepID=A0A3G4ZZP8_9VIRU|nr:MAG: hypothetical protein Harvfovirus1_30 [Harvfovirus sp.]